MELDSIEKLLEKYFEASTTTAEEEKLKQYFTQETVATHLEQYAPMFQYFSNAKEERFTKEVPLASNKIVARKNYFRWASVAAVVLLFGIYFGSTFSKTESGLTSDQLAEAEYAEKELKKALDLLSENFNKGTEKVAYLNEFETTKQKIYNTNN